MITRFSEKAGLFDHDRITALQKARLYRRVLAKDLTRRFEPPQLAAA